MVNHINEGRERENIEARNKQQERRDAESVRVHGKTAFEEGEGEGETEGNGEDEGDEDDHEGEGGREGVQTESLSLMNRSAVRSFCLLNFSVQRSSKFFLHSDWVKRTLCFTSSPSSPSSIRVFRVSSSLIKSNRSRNHSSAAEVQTGPPNFDCRKASGPGQKDASLSTKTETSKELINLLIL
jgi:hypothetical protein